MRYVAIPPRPKAEHEYWDDPAPTTQTVLVEDDMPIKTGLYDQFGTPLYRVSEKIKPGFRR